MLRVEYRVNINIALGAIMPGSDYITLADRLARRIERGELLPGDRLPTQRTFAYEEGIATSTASRVYAELLRRGLVVGEVGRGTFVARRQSIGETAETEAHDGRVDLEFNFPILSGQAAMVAHSLAGLQRADAMDLALRPISSWRFEAARRIIATLLASARWTPHADAIVFTGSGRQSIAAAISSLVPVGGRLGVETLTYPL